LRIFAGGCELAREDFQPAPASEFGQYSKYFNDFAAFFDNFHLTDDFPSAFGRSLEGRKE
jgi:hypothetical protein